MKNRMLKENDPLINVITKELMDVPSSEFSAKLLQTSIASYKVSYSIKYRKEERLGKIIMLVLIFFNLMTLYILNPLNLTPVAAFFFLAGGLLVGLSCLWMILKSSQTSRSKIELKLPSLDNFSNVTH